MRKGDKVMVRTIKDYKRRVFVRGPTGVMTPVNGLRGKVVGKGPRNEVMVWFPSMRRKVSLHPEWLRHV